MNLATSYLTNNTHPDRSTFARRFIYGSSSHLSSCSPYYPLSRLTSLLTVSMADVKEKDYNSRSDDNSRPHIAIYDRPTGIKGIYYLPITQVSMLGFVCFMCPGLFNALTGLGAGGQVDPTTGAKANTALYATFAAAAFFSGSINNKLGSRITLLLGTLGYALYIGSFLAMNINPHAGTFVIAAGAILGICAGLLWTAQGSLMLAYPTEDQKGKFIGLFWGIFSTGSVMGASVSLGENFHSTANSVGNGTYIGFLILTLIGVIIPLVMANPDNMSRTDGTKVTTPRSSSWKVEIYGLWLTLRTDPMIILLFPMFLASNWFYTWQFNEYNDALFNIRARSLNNLVYWISQIVGSFSIGFLLDQRAISRRVRAFSGLTVLLAMVFIVHTWAFFYQKQYTRASLPPDSNNKLDIFDRGYTARVWLYVFCSLLDAMWQTTAYWLMGTMSNDPAKLAYLTGFYKSIQSAGAAGAWEADFDKTPFMNMLISTWALLVAGLVFAFPMIYSRVKDHTEFEDEILMRMDDAGNLVSPHHVPHDRVPEK